MNLLDKYYQAIMSRVESEVYAINGVFEHQGVKGSGNESILIELLSKFLPKKYGIGTGVVVDRNGCQSKQTDIVIYDAINYPEIFSLTSAKFFPIDFVYAVIEVKTTIDSTKLNDAVLNIRSVQSLDFIKQEFRCSPTDPVTELNDDTILWYTKSTTPPLGLIFGYATKTGCFDTFAGWMQPSRDDIGPSHIFALDQGFLVDSKGEKGIIKFLLPFVKDDNYKDIQGVEYQNRNGKKWAEIDGRMMPFSKIADQEVAVDQAKVLLHFLVIVSELLRQKFLSPNISVYKNYISESNRTLFTISDGKLAVHKIGT